MDSDTLHAHSAGFESWSKQCHTLFNRVMSPKIVEWLEVTLVISTVLRTFAIGRREWIPNCLASLQIGGTSSGYFVTGLVSSTIQLRSGWTRQQVHLDSLGKRSRIAETDKALYWSLALVCKNEALDVVKTVTHKRGFES